MLAPLAPHGLTPGARVADPLPPHLSPQVECGYQFTQKLEGMFMDIRVSTDTMDLYKTHVAQQSSVRALAWRLARARPS